MIKVKITFTPSSVAVRLKNLTTISYPVMADNLLLAERCATRLLESEGYCRSDFNNKVGHTPIQDEAEAEPAPATPELATPESEPAPDMAANDAELGDWDGDWDDWDDWGAEAAAAWTVASLNERLEQLKASETLVIDNLSDEIYHGAIGISCSKIKLFLECPMKYHAKYIAGSVEDEEKDHLELGKAIHCLVLEPWRFDSAYLCQPDDIKVRSGKRWEEFKAAAGDKTILTARQWKVIEAAKKLPENAQYQHAVMPLTQGGVCERSIFRRDVETGMIIKVRPDYTLGRMIVDLKTCSDATVRGFSASIKRFGYHIQDAMYCDVSGAELFVFVAIENNAPCAFTSPITLDGELKRLGYLQYRKALREIKHCMDTGIWPTYTTEHVSVSLNQWEKQQLETLEAEVLALEHKDTAA